MRTRTVYADTSVGRLGALATEKDGVPVAAVYIVHGGLLGFYPLERFEGGKLTAATLRKLFTIPMPTTPDELRRALDELFPEEGAWHDARRTRASLNDLADLKARITALNE